MSRGDRPLLVVAVCMQLLLAGCGAESDGGAAGAGAAQAASERETGGVGSGAAPAPAEPAVQGPPLAALPDGAAVRIAAEVFTVAQPRSEALSGLRALLESAGDGVLDEGAREVLAREIGTAQAAGLLRQSQRAMVLVRNDEPASIACEIVPPKGPLGLDAASDRFTLDLHPRVFEGADGLLTRLAFAARCERQEGTLSTLMADAGLPAGAKLDKAGEVVLKEGQAALVGGVVGSGASLAYQLVVLTPEVTPGESRGSAAAEAGAEGGHPAGAGGGG